MKNKIGWWLLVIVMAIVAGQGLHWFVGGESAAGSPVRRALVIAEIVVAIALIVVGLRRLRSKGRSA